MKTSRYPIVVLGWLASIVLLAGIALAAFGQASSAPAAGEGKESLEVRYARASLKLAEMDLQKALDVNKQVKRALPPYAIDPLRAVVNIAEKQLQYALHKDAETALQVRVAIAEAKLAGSRLELETALAANKESAGLFSNAEIERLQQAVEVAQLGVERARAVNDQSQAEYLAWQVEYLQKEVLRLQARISTLCL